MSVGAISSITRSAVVAELCYHGRPEASKGPRAVEPAPRVAAVDAITVTTPGPARVEPPVRPNAVPGAELRRGRPRLNDAGREQIDWQGRPDPWALRARYDLPASFGPPRPDAPEGHAEDGLLSRLLRRMVETYEKIFSPPLGRLVDVAG